MEKRKELQSAVNLLIISVICIPLGLLIGAIDALFGRILIFISNFRTQYTFYLVPFLALAGLLIVFCYSKFGKGTDKGMGLVFAAGHGESDDIPLRLVPFVMISTWITHLFGGSAGREGVAVQIGGTISFWAGKKLPVKNCKRIFLIAGMAAGFSGLFQTPLAAVCFALEVMTAGAIEYVALIPSIIAACTACTTSNLLGLEKFTVSLAADTSITMSVFGKLIVLGIAFGITGGGFAALLKWTKSKFAQIFKNPLSRITAISIALSAVLLILYKGRYCGLGTNLIKESFSADKIYAWDFAFKFILTIATLSAGFQGGEVTPLFSIGASLGAVLGGFIGLPSELTAALGYAAVFGSATNTFFAPVFIGAEVFGFQYLPFFFIACSVAYFANMNKSIYGGQKLLQK